MREVDESCSAHIDGWFLVVDVPGARITHRLVLDADWYRALADAFDLCSRHHCCGRRRECCARARDAALARQLALTAEPLSRFERQIIFTNATGRHES